jgi:hypothetical protein
MHQKKNHLRCAELCLDEEGGGGTSHFTVGEGCWLSYKIARIIISLHNSLVTIYGGNKLKTPENEWDPSDMTFMHLTTNHLMQ